MERRPLFKIMYPDGSKQIVIYTNGDTEGLPEGYNVIVNCFPALANGMQYCEGYDPYHRQPEHPHP